MISLRWVAQLSLAEDAHNCAFALWSGHRTCIIDCQTISPATAKGRMKCQKQGVRSTWKTLPNKGDSVINIPTSIRQVAPIILPIFVEPPQYHGPAYGAQSQVNIIPDDKSIAYVFCFGAFANKISGVVYNDLTGNSPSCPLAAVCVSFLMYHYKTNAILVKAIKNLDNHSIQEAYKELFDTLEAKGYKPKLMSWIIKRLSTLKKFSPQRVVTCRWSNHTTIR